MQKKIFLTLAFLIFSPLFLFLLVILLLYYKNQSLTKGLSLSNNAVYFRALPERKADFYISLETKDARIEVLQDFFKKHSSSLLPFAAEIVAKADEYSLDYRLLPAIAMQESNLCKKIPQNSFNCFGFGIYGGKVLKFSGYDEAINSVSKALSQEYAKKGLVNPKEIMTKYNPTNTNSWAESVSYFMQNLQIDL